MFLPACFMFRTYFRETITNCTRDAVNTLLRAKRATSCTSKTFFERGLGSTVTPRSLSGLSARHVFTRLNGRVSANSRGLDMFFPTLIVSAVALGVRLEVSSRGQSSVTTATLVIPAS